MESSGHMYSLEILPLKCQHDRNNGLGKAASKHRIPFFLWSARAPQPVHPSFAEIAQLSFEVCFMFCLCKQWWFLEGSVLFPGFYLYFVANCSVFSRLSKQYKWEGKKPQTFSNFEVKVPPSLFYNLQLCFRKREIYNPALAVLSAFSTLFFSRDLRG